MELNECINFQLTGAQNAVFNYFKSKLAAVDVTPVQYALLKCLWTEDMQTPTQLAQALDLDASSITGILARLEKKELVERVYCKEDRRSVQVRLLSGGAALRAPIEKIILDANVAITGGIAPEDYEKFLAQLQVIRANAKEA